MVCECGNTQGVKLRVFGSKGTVRVARICQECYMPPEEAQVTYLTVLDLVHLLTND